MPAPIDPFPITSGGLSGQSIATWATRAILAVGSLAAIITGANYFSTDTPQSAEDYTPSNQYFRNSPDPESEKGPFRFKFTKGEQRIYALQAGVTGSGLDVGNPEGVDMHMASNMILETKNVDRDGKAQLELRFDETTFQGDFMGSPYEMFVTQTIARATHAGRNTVPETNKKSSNPQIAFFQHPIQMEVGPDGNVTHLDGPGEISALLAQAPLYSDLEFPRSELTSGESWVSEFALPIPGLAQAPKAQILNHYQGTDVYAGRECGVIHQTLSSAQTNGAVQSSFGADQELMGFSIPDFNLAGENIVYFDLNDGAVVYTDMRLNVKLSLGQVLGGAGDAIEGLLEGMGNLVGDELPEFQGFGQKRPGQESLLDLDLDIAATLALQ